MRKVTIGFKGDPSLKLELKEEADEAEMTVSEYLEAIAENRNMKDDVKMLRYRLRQAIQDKDNLLEKLEQYEELISPFYEDCKGKVLPYRNKDGSMTSKIVNYPIDMLDCILSSINRNHE